MVDFAANIGKGRAVELYNRVESDDPSASALILVPFSASGTEAQGQDLDTLAAVEADANFAEQATGSWVRKTLTQTELAAFPAPDDTNNRYAVALPATTWTGPTTNTTGLGVFYDADTGAGTDSNLTFLSHHTFTVTGDGSDVVLNAGDFYRST